MNRPPSVNRPRTAFTLVELLVVIAIIAILVSLTTAAVMQVLGAREDVTARTEVGQMANAIAQFKMKYNTYPISKVFLAPTQAAYNRADPVHQNSLAVLTAICQDWGSGSVDWSGGRGLPAGGVTLEGDQALVFFLG